MAYAVVRWLVSAPRKIVGTIARHGPRMTLLWAVHEGTRRWYEWRLGVDTHGFISASELSDDPERIEYEPIDSRCLLGAFRQIGVRAGHDVFLDYGCGKGRAVVLASTFPFRRVLGVESVAELCDDARENVRRAGKKLRCTEIEIVEADAASYDVPHDVTLVLLFNPFTGGILSAALQRMAESVRGAPRTFRILYMRPKAHADALAKYDWLTKETDLSTGWCTWVNFSLYAAKLGIQP